MREAELRVLVRGAGVSLAGAAGEGLAGRWLLWVLGELGHHLGAGGKVGSLQEGEVVPGVCFG